MSEFPQEIEVTQDLPPNVRLPRGAILNRLLRGVEWCWRSKLHAAWLPAHLFDHAMTEPGRDRLHAKQGRSTSRVRLDGPQSGLSVYLKRHFRSTRFLALRALLGTKPQSPAAIEWQRLSWARELDVLVPNVVACGERIGPGLRFQSFLMVEELVGFEELNLAVPRALKELSSGDFQRWKQQVIQRLAAAVARLHEHSLFHKDLYLCHVFVPTEPPATAVERLTLIDLHRLASHRFTWPRWLLKDLGQLLFSTFGVVGISDRDRARFWICYKRLRGSRSLDRYAPLIRAKAARYLRHEKRRSERTQ
jgi:heptose I phosphotransferase